MSVSSALAGSPSVPPIRTGARPCPSRKVKGASCFAALQAAPSRPTIVDALGLQQSDTFYESLSTPQRQQRATKAILKGVCSESLVIVCAASPIGPPLNVEDRARLKAASARLRAALSLQGLQGRDEITRIAGYADRLLTGDPLDRTDREALTDCVEWIGWLIADEQKPGGKARLQGVA